MLKSIEEQIWQQASLHGDKIAVKSGKKSATYQELCDRTLAARDKILSVLSPGERVVIAAGKQIEFLYAYFGIHLAGLTAMPIDPATNPDRLRYIVEQAHACALIGFGETDLPLLQIPLDLFEDLEKSYQDVSFPELDAVADILFTTGTTGRPKGVPLTFANEAAAARNINAFIGNAPEDVEELALPISHSFGLGRVRCCLSNGQTLILLGGFTNVKKLFRIMEEENVSGFSMVPAGWRYLQKLSGNKLGDYAGQLKYIEMGSAYFSAEEKRNLADLLSNTRVCMHYGLTEASRSAFMEFHADASALDSVGKASPFTEIAVFDETGKEVAAGAEGEIAVKGEHVTLGYLGIPNDESFYGDYFRTGDWGYKTPEGYIHLISRKKELINVGGKKVSPIEVEEQLMKLPGVEDCACIGVADKDGVLGEVVKAFIVKSPDADLTFESLHKQMLGKLEPYKLPVEYAWIDAIPKTQNGKILRGELK